MRNITKINDFIQSYLGANKLRSITPNEIAEFLEKEGLLKDSRTSHGLPLRKLCRNKEIHGSSQPDGRHWIIEFDPAYVPQTCGACSAVPFKESSVKTEALIFDGDHCESLEAYIPKNSRILVLGTMPGKDSLRLGQYYMNSGNRFWKIIAAAAGQPLPDRYEDRLKLLDLLHIALWDVFVSAEREGSLDKNIRNGERNDIQGFLETNPSIVKILFNGKKANENALDYGCKNAVMPSTSSSNTHYTQDELFSIWISELKEV